MMSAVRRSSRGSICRCIRCVTPEPNRCSEYEPLRWRRCLGAPLTASVCVQVRGVRLPMPPAGLAQVSHDQAQGGGGPGVRLCDLRQALREGTQSERAHVHGASSSCRAAAFLLQTVCWTQTSDPISPLLPHPRDAFTAAPRAHRVVFEPHTETSKLRADRAHASSPS